MSIVALLMLYDHPIDVNCLVWNCLVYLTGCVRLYKYIHSAHTNKTSGVFCVHILSQNCSIQYIVGPLFWGILCSGLQKMFLPNKIIKMDICVERIQCWNTFGSWHAVRNSSQAFQCTEWIVIVFIWSNAWLLFNCTKSSNSYQHFWNQISCLLSIIYIYIYIYIIYIIYNFVIYI
jgi:hypothetical protein